MPGQFSDVNVLLLQLNIYPAIDKIIIFTDLLVLQYKAVLFPQISVHELKNER
jgi:hypothetical protein